MWYFMRVLIATQTSDSQDMRMFFDNYIYLKDIMKDTKYNDVKILASQLYQEFSHIQ